jgi:hypothetical protein
MPFRSFTRTTLRDFSLLRPHLSDCFLLINNVLINIINTTLLFKFKTPLMSQTKDASNISATSKTPQQTESIFLASASDVIEIFSS